MKISLLLKSTAVAGLLATGAALAEPATYPSPQQAIDSFVMALTARDRAALLKTVLGRLRPGGLVVIPMATIEALGELRPQLEAAASAGQGEPKRVQQPG